MTIAAISGLLLVGALFGGICGFTIAWIGFTATIAGDALDENGNDRHEHHHC